MALVIARIRRAEKRERGECAQDHQSVNGEKIFMSLTSAECTEVECATERYSESPPPVWGDTATRKRHRGFAPHIQVELDSSSDEAPTSYLLEIHCQIDHNEMLQRRLAHSTKFLSDAERIAMGKGNVPASQDQAQVVRPLCPLPLFHRLIGGKTAQASALARRRMQSAKITRHKVYFQRTVLKYFRA
jgi:hypothetical protein